MSRKERIISISALAFLLATVVALSAILLIPRSGAAKPKSATYYDYFNTITTIYDHSGDTTEQFNEMCDTVARIFKQYHELCDIYHSYDGVTNVKDINDAAGKGPIAVCEELMDLLEYAVDMHAITDGALNIAFGAVLSIWHEYRTEANLTPSDHSDNRLPTKAELEAASTHCDISRLVLDRESMTAELTDPDMSLDLGAVAKGYATEMAARALAAMGADGYAIDAGGNLRMIGEKPGGDGWVTGIRNPLGDGLATSMELKNTSCVTSGGYERYYTVVTDGVPKRYHHIINRETLMPAEFFASVTVVHPDSGLADCLSTALFNSSYEDALKILQRVREAGLGEAEVIFITQDGEIIRT